MLDTTEVQYVSDAKNNNIDVIVPIELWWELASERETAICSKARLVCPRYFSPVGKLVSVWL